MEEIMCLKLFDENCLKVLDSHNSKLELTRSEVERLEHTIIESGKARIESNIQYVPYIKDTED